ncbi:hypothetical protein Tsubulata_020473 [Turnera subulata]|uniref:Squalene monooxygenase n=1 Tax=Turnera subulata TaxID=218843 RepID=A0A9Q0GHN4_9ROSI|nr:hypothetical protein Tsubulata_020473 [Turnera subulata]
MASSRAVEKTQESLSFFTCSTLKMDCTFTVGGLIACLLWFTLIYSSKKKRNTGISMKDLSREASKRSANGKARSDNDDGSMDVIIVGAGVAGAALAYALGKDGWRVHVIERDLTEPDRIVGELLQPGGYLKLIDLDLDDCVSGIDAEEVFGVVFYKDGRSLKLPFPSNVYGRSLHNGRMIQKMRKKAASLPNVRFEEGTVTSLVKEKGIIKGVHYKTKAGQESTAYAPLTIVSDGCFSNLRGSLCNPKVRFTSRCIGFVIETSDVPHANYWHSVLTDPGLFFHSIGTNEVRFIVTFSGDVRIPSVSNGELGKYLRTKVAPQVPQELRDAFISAIDKANIKTATEVSVPASPRPTPGGLLIGDALNARHPITGGGMTVAFSDVVLLRDLLRPLSDLDDPFALSKYLESFYTLRKPMACCINSMAGLLMNIFAPSNDPLNKAMSNACFDYFCLGHKRGIGLLSLISGLYPSRLCLLSHIFALALFAVARLLLPFPSPKRLWAAIRLLMGASSVAFTVIKEEGIRETFFPWTVPAYYRGPPAY